MKETRELKIKRYNAGLVRSASKLLGDDVGRVMIPKHERQADHRFNYVRSLLECYYDANSADGRDSGPETPRGWTQNTGMESSHCLLLSKLISNVVGTEVFEMLVEHGYGKHWHVHHDLDRSVLGDFELQAHRNDPNYVLAAGDLDVQRLWQQTSDCFEDEGVFQAALDKLARDQFHSTEGKNPPANLAERSKVWPGANTSPEVECDGHVWNGVDFLNQEECYAFAKLFIEKYGAAADAIRTNLDERNVASHTCADGDVDDYGWCRLQCDICDATRRRNNEIRNKHDIAGYGSGGGL